MMDTPTTPTTPPTAMVAMVNHNGFDTITPAGADLVVDVTGHLVHVMVPLPGLLATIRLSFNVDQLGALLDDLCEAAELATS